MAINRYSREQRLASIVATGVLTVALMSMAGPVSATTLEPSVDQGACSLSLDTGKLICVEAGEDLNAAVLEQTGQQVITPSSVDVDGESMAESRFGVQATYVLTQIFSYPNYGGSMFQFTSTTFCTGATYAVSDLRTHGWNDDIDSFKSYGPCATALYEDIWFGGSVYGYYVSSSNVGIMQNQASSLRIH